jgi:alpha-L-rhamnosidase
MGQNFSGWARISVQGRRGARVRLRFAEMLDSSGDVYLENLRTARATDEYVLAGSGVERWEPSFTYHGFRYVHVEAPGVELGESSITGIVAHSDTPAAGTFECSDELVNRLQRNILWGQRSNFFEVPTDCPQRDERLGWMGDAQVFVGTAAFNMDVAAFFSKWYDDVVDARHDNGAFPDIAPEIRPSRTDRRTRWPDGAPGWGDAGVMVPWALLVHYGDVRICADNLPRFADWVEHIRTHNPDGVWRNHRGNDYGDWLSVGEETPKEVVATAFFHRSAQLTADIAARLGEAEVQRHHERLAQHIRDAFVRTFVDEDGRILGDTQTGYVLALRFGLLDGARRDRARDHLLRRLRDRDGLLSTGFLAVGHLLPVLSECGEDDTAFALLTETRFPSWGYSITHGATTIWERWDGWTEHSGFQTPEMNSFNHYSLGSVGEWIHDRVGGIAPDPDAPGYRRVLVRPRPGGGITWARARLESIRGPIATAWEVRDGQFVLDVDVPPGVEAAVDLPGTSVVVGSGHHTFTVPHPQASASQPPSSSVVSASA